MSRAQSIADSAAAWVIRREEDDWSNADQADFDAWLAQSDGNRAAYWRLKHCWQEVGRIRSLGVQIDDPVKRSYLARHLKPFAIAASLLAVAGFGAISLLEPDAAQQVAVVRHGTPVGGRDTVPLADGSKIELNTNTSVRSAMSVQKRDVWLDVGEAYFEVARDTQRPFVVHAGQKTITVLGTKFAVRRDGDRVTVSVLEGRVRIDDAADPGMTEATSATITGGVTAISRGSSTLVTQRSAERVQDALAWRDGVLSFDGTRLDDVAAEFNRYNVRPIVVTDAETAAIRIGGTFQAANVDAFVRLLRDAYGLKIVSEAEVIKISS